MHTRFSSLTFSVATALLLSAAIDSRLTTALAADNSKARPFLAIWQESDGSMRASDAPYLRIAIWDDGRIVFADEPTKWSHNLREGTVDAASLDQLKKAIEATGVFKLKGTCYLVPDAAVDCMMLDFGDKQQMLYWDEVESASYGINISPKPHHLEFKKCWKEINKLALAAIPKESEPYKVRFQRPPESWRLKEAIQSK
jgi:hypothetical protein